MVVQRHQHSNGCGNVQQHQNQRCHPSQEQLAEHVRLLQKELQETKRLMGNTL